MKVSFMKKFSFNKNQWVRLAITAKRDMQEYIL